MLEGGIARVEREGMGACVEGDAARVLDTVRRALGR
jgi:hypothetical protein